MLIKSIVTLPAFQLIGRSTRTNNEGEFQPSTAKIGPMVQQYFMEGMFNHIPNRLKPGTTYCVYTDYESEHHRDYTYFIGELTEIGTKPPEGFEARIIRAETYAKFTTTPGPMPTVVIEAWQAIWSMNSNELGGKRAYQADFEIYDERANNHAQVVMDIYIGIKT